jgi:hypothetical protein
VSRDTAVVYFQAAAARRRRPGGTVPQLLGQMELQHGEALAIAALQKASCDVRELVEAALDVAHLTKDRAAAQFMQITPSLFGRQLQNEDNQHLSTQRLWLLPDEFWRDFLISAAVRRGLARVQPRRVDFL